MRALHLCFGSKRKRRLRFIGHSEVSNCLLSSPLFLFFTKVNISLILTCLRHDFTWALQQQEKRKHHKQMRAYLYLCALLCKSESHLFLESKVFYLKVGCSLPTREKLQQNRKQDFDFNAHFYIHQRLWKHFWLCVLEPDWLRASCSTGRMDGLTTEVEFGHSFMRLISVVEVKLTTACKQMGGFQTLERTTLSSPFFVNNCVVGD